MKFKRLIERGKDLLKKTSRFIARDITTSTALLIVASPFQAINDTYVLEYLGKAFNSDNMMAMTNESSIYAKFGVAAITYCGAGWGYRKGREVYRRLLGISDKTNEVIQGVNDWIYTAAYSSSVLIGGYLYSHESDWWKIGTALTISAASQSIRGPLIGYSVDCFQDMFGFKECNRTTYPSVVKRMGRKGKAVVAAGAVAASIGLMALLYNLTPSEWSNPNRLQERKQNIQQLEKTKHSQQLGRTYSIQSLEEIV